MLRVLEAFSITGRGTAVALDGTTDLPVGHKLHATVHCPDGSKFEAIAYKEWLRRHSPEPLETEAFLLMGVDKADVPEGAQIELVRTD